MKNKKKPVILGKNSKKHGIVPAIAMCNPKYARNVSMAIRLASCYGVEQLWFTGNRVHLELEQGKRLPREERMKGYKDVDVIHHDYFFDQFDRGVTPVGIEVRPNAENLFEFEHPENALYVFGPEDGSIPKVFNQHIHRFVVIPTRHCLNLATAIATVLYDRNYKQFLNGKTDFTTPGEFEERGWYPNQENLVYGK